MDEEVSRDKIETNLRTLLSHQELLEASMKPLAQLLKAKMDALVEAGFTREEALDVIKARGLNA